MLKLLCHEKLISNLWYRCVPLYVYPVKLFLFWCQFITFNVVSILTVYVLYVFSIYPFWYTWAFHQSNEFASVSKNLWLVFCCCYCYHCHYFVLYFWYCLRILGLYGGYNECKCKWIDTIEAERTEANRNPPKRLVQSPLNAFIE